jgi:hypothetical protein
MFTMDDTLLGQVLDGRYRLIEVLFDAGPRGVVYRAEHLRLTRSFVIKVFRDPAGPEFDEAARKLSCIRHPHVEAIHDYGRVDDGRPYVVTEMLVGESLAERMERALDQLEVLALLKDAGAGLAEAHAVGLVHGSIKPENVFFEAHRSGETLKLLDFDLPTSRSKSSFIDEVQLASAAWLSPEQAKGLSAEPASDVHALGAIAYACLADQPPYDGEPHVVLSKKLEGEVTPLRRLSFPIDVDEEVDELILSMLEREPYRRPAAAAVVEQAETLHGELTMPPLPQPVRSRAPWFGLAATLMGAAALLVAELRAPHAPHPMVTPSTGSITIDSDPIGAEIYLDGQPLLTVDGEPAVTPADVQSLLYGKRYRVQLRHPGYIIWETELAMNHEIDGRAYAPELSPLPARLAITAPIGSLIFVDELAVGRGRYLEETVQPLRPHLIRATSRDGDCGEMVVRPEPGATLAVNLSCTGASGPLQTDPARLTVTGDPNADVYLDEVRIGSPPLVDVSLRPGDHRLTIKSAEAVRTMMLDAEPGNTIRYHVP